MSASLDARPVVKGSHLRQPRKEEELLTFSTSTPPVVHENTIIVAAAAPNVFKGHPKKDGWFLSDFYAFNYILKGLGSSQLWLTAANPTELLESDPDNFTTLLHGNAYRDRKVVLSKELIKAGELTEPVVVDSTAMKDRFLSEVARASSQSYREKKPLLLLVFCHGNEKTHLLLDCGDKRTGLSIQQLKAVLEPGSCVTLVTTACYSGGWTTTPDLNLTAATGADAESVSNSWALSQSMGRACGSIFGSAFIESLSGVSSSLLAQTGHTPDPAEGMQALQASDSLLPENPNDLQTETYNAFCGAILDTLREKMPRFWDREAFSFNAKDDRWDDSWTGRTGVPLSDFEKRWNKLVTVPYTGNQDIANTRDVSPLYPSSTGPGASFFTGGTITNGEELVSEMTACIHRRDIAGMAQLFWMTSPDDWNKSNTVYLNGMIRDFLEGPLRYPEQNEELAATIQYRWEFCLFADHILRILGLRSLHNQICILWNEHDWILESERHLSPSEREKRWDVIFKRLLDGFKPFRPQQDQGYFYDRPIRYLAAALIQTQKSEADTLDLVNRVLQFLDQAKALYESCAAKTPAVRQTGREFFESVGRRLRS
ncbi:hypothetical protein GGR54DRAFT_635236 [Hypoxylon sp. NC1633]|nr:hypothetical protein GGR54DRAFT_635236 [Hypoxylon sp. NC1633]